jgi:hypothetical protein
LTRKPRRLLGVIAALMLVQAMVPAAHAKDTNFKVTVQFEETLKTTFKSTDPYSCQAPVTSSETVRMHTTRPAAVNAYMVDAGSSKGFVELAPSGSGYAQLVNIAGTVDRESDNVASPCSGPSPPPDCGTRSPKKWYFVLQPHGTGITVSRASTWAAARSIRSTRPASSRGIHRRRSPPS